MSDRYDASLKEKREARISSYDFVFSALVIQTRSQTYRESTSADRESKMKPPPYLAFYKTRSCNSSNTMSGIHNDSIPM